MFPSLLIEIVDWDKGLLRLANGDACNGKYTTLSYRWGDTGSHDYVTNMSNVECRRKCFLLSSLPATIRHAITLTFWLGIRHTWVDAM